MDTTKAVELFERNWFLRDREKPELTPAERQLVAAAMGPDPKRWHGTPDVERMEEILTGNPQVLDRIGEHLLQVVAGMRGCGQAVTFLLDHDVPLGIDESAYNVLHEAAWGGMEDTPPGGIRVGGRGRDRRFGTEASRRLAGQPLPHVLGGGWRVHRVRKAPDPVRRRRSSRAADQGER